MGELTQLFNRFREREIGEEELTSSFVSLLENNVDLAAPAAALLDANEAAGALPATVCASLKIAIDTQIAAFANGRPTVTVPPSGDEPTPHPKTVLIRNDGTVLATEAADLSPEPSKTRIARSSGGAVDIELGEGGTADGKLGVGAVIGGRYELQTELGSGGMGTVFKAQDRLRVEAQDRDPYVALKVLSDTFKRHPDSMIALQREVRRAQSMAHPNVITVHEFFKDGPHYYMTMELLDGCTLGDLLKNEYQGALTMEVAWPIIENVGKALQYGHEQGIVHSDIKPGNIFVCSNSTVKVLDFGISRPIPLADVPAAEQTVFDPRTRLGTLTPSHASLEMWYGDSADPRDDIYSLAVVAYRLLSGRHPFYDDSENKAHSAKLAYEKNLAPKPIKSITRGQWSAIAGALQLRRGDRTKTVSEFLKQLAPENAGKSRRRAMVLLSILIVVAGIGIALNLYRRALEDEVFEQQNGVVPASIEVTPAQQEEIDGFLRLALYDLENGISENDSAEVLEYLLTSSATSVENSIGAALDINPGDEEALALRARVGQLYRTRAEAFFAQRNYESAWLMATNAGRIENSRGIERLKRQICDRAPDVCSD